jgi:hypothetical protein
MQKASESSEALQLAGCSMVAASESRRGMQEPFRAIKRGLVLLLK